MIRRYERDHPGDLVHIDIKKPGRIPDGGGWKVLDRQAGKKNNDGRNQVRIDYGYIHSAVDDHSRIAYCEIAFFAAICPGSSARFAPTLVARVNAR